MSDPLGARFQRVGRVLPMRLSRLGLHAIAVLGRRAVLDAPPRRRWRRPRSRAPSSRPSAVGPAPLLGGGQAGSCHSAAVWEVGGWSSIGRSSTKCSCNASFSPIFHCSGTDLGFLGTTWYAWLLWRSHRPFGVRCEHRISPSPPSNPAGGTAAGGGWWPLLAGRAAGWVARDPPLWNRAPKGSDIEPACLVTVLLAYLVRFSCCSRWANTVFPKSFESWYL